VVQRCQSARFTPKPRQALRVARKLRGQRLNCDIPTEFPIVCAIDLAHSTGAQQRYDSKGSELTVYRGGCDCRKSRCGRFQESPDYWLAIEELLHFPTQVEIPFASSI
jgi:hypothetical protein